MSPGLLLSLRTVVLLGVAAAVLDPGCSTRRPVPVSLWTGPSVDAREADDLARAVRAAGFDLRPDAGPDAIRVATGTPREIVDEVRPSSPTLAVRPSTPRAHVVGIGAPAMAVAGLALTLHVDIADVPPDGGHLVVRVRDVLTGRIAGSAPVDATPAPASSAAPDASADGSTTGNAPSAAGPDVVRRVDVALLPLSPGPWALCVSVEPDATPPDHAGDCVTIDLQVAPETVRVHVLEARPAWAARFARLALARADGIVVSSTSRVAPGIAVRGEAAAASLAATASVGDTPDITLVAGLDALTSADVSGLVRLVRDEGRTVVLLADGPLPVRGLGALWTGRPGTPRSRATPAAVTMGTHRLSAREWLALDGAATDATPLAYLATSPATPVVWGRALGAGRVVLMAALDTWRWRSDDDGTHDAAWQALVWSLAALRQGTAPRAWRIRSGQADELHVSVTADRHRGDGAGWFARWAADAAGGAAGGTAEGDTGEGRGRVTMARTEAGWRGVVTVPSGASLVELSPDASDASAFGDGRLQAARAASGVAGWADVERVVSASGGAVVTADALVPALQRAAAGRDVAGPRWFVTRQWWYAAWVIGALGCEWWLRRLARQR